MVFFTINSFPFLTALRDLQSRTPIKGFVILFHCLDSYPQEPKVQNSIAFLSLLREEIGI